MDKTEIDKTKLLELLGSNIRMLRSFQGFSQEGFAKHVGLDRSYMGGIERGERNISAIALILIARSLGVHIGKLFKGIK